MSTNANFVAVPRNAGCVISTANTNRDGTGTLGNVMTGANRNVAAAVPLSGGSRIDALTIAALGAVTDGMVRLFIDDGSAKRLIAEVPVQATTPSATVRTWQIRLNSATTDLLPIVLADGASLKASTEKAESFAVAVTQGGDF